VASGTGTIPSRYCTVGSGVYRGVRVVSPAERTMIRWMRGVGAETTCKAGVRSPTSLFDFGISPSAASRTRFDWMRAA
jgi:hypothetical protein